MIDPTSGSFTLPGEAGYEALTLTLAGRWGADAVRDSDGTTLSDSILKTGLSVYATLCVIRKHNEWIMEHPDCRQQTILSTFPRVCDGEPLPIGLMAVYDRTAGEPLPAGDWTYDPDTRSVTVRGKAFHSYTVSFFAWRIWEEISMYNHTTNGWNS